MKTTIKKLIVDEDYFQTATFTGDPMREISLDFAQKNIEKNFPSLIIKTIRFYDAGMDNAGFIINEDYIFRFPRYDGANIFMKTEILMLPEIANNVCVTVPNILYIGNCYNNSLFAGYRFIQGVALDKRFLLTPAGLFKTNLVDIIITFIRDLHSFNINVAKKCGVRERNLHSYYLGQQKRTVGVLFPILENYYPGEAMQLKDGVLSIFNNYLNDKNNFDFTAVLCHGDLKKEHILYDHHKDTISGIIDFGGLIITDPDFDYWRPYSDFGKDFILSLLRNHPYYNTDVLFRKLDFFMRARIIHRLVRSILRKENFDERLKSFRVEILHYKQ